MRVVLAGGTGLVGRELARRLVGRGDQVTVLTRRAKSRGWGLPQQVRLEVWTPGVNTEGLSRVLAGADGVINLAGASVGSRRWSARRRRQLLSSRVNATRGLVNAMAGLAAQDRPRVLVNASGIDYYGDVPLGMVDESSPTGGSFLALVCRQWEAEAERAAEIGVRVNMLRTAAVLSPSAMALTLLALPFRLWIGGPLGSGKQFFSWIHMDDLVRIYEWALTDHAASGPINAVAPEALSNQQAASTIGRVLRRPSRLRTPAPLLRLAMGQQADLLLHGRRAVSRALPRGFSFRFPDFEGALRDALNPKDELTGIASPFQPALTQSLPPVLHAQYLERPQDMEAVLSGSMDRVWHRPAWIAPILCFLALSNVVFPEEGTSVPAEIRVAADKDGGGRPVEWWLRSFRFPRVRRFDARIEWSSRLQRVVERLGPARVIEVVWRVEYAAPDRIDISTEAIRLAVGCVRLRLPDWSSVAVRAEELVTGASSIRVELEVSQPLLGPIFGYEGNFTLALSPQRGQPGRV